MREGWLESAVESRRYRWLRLGEVPNPSTEQMLENVGSPSADGEPSWWRHHLVRQHGRTVLAVLDDRREMEEVLTPRTGDPFPTPADGRSGRTCARVG